MAITRTKKAVGEAKRIDFYLTAPSASKVSVAGTFNSWDYKKAPLVKGKDNTWRTSLNLKPGRYEYKFVVDGNWITDPKNSNRSWSSLGTENSIVEVK